LYCLQHTAVSVLSSHTHTHTTVQNQKKPAAKLFSVFRPTHTTLSCYCKPTAVWPVLSCQTHAHRTVGNQK